MDEGQWQIDGAVRRWGAGEAELQSEVGSAHSPDQNQNRLLEEVEEVEQGPRGGQKLLQQDSANNNGRDEDGEEEGSRVEEEEEDEDEDMDSNSGAFSPELDGHIQESPSLSPSPTVSEGALSPVDVPVGVAPSPRLSLSPSLAASLQALEEQGDHALLPHCLHQIAEALVKEGDYTRAVRFLQLQKLYHERVLSNIATLQEQWESRWRLCRSSSDVGDVAPPPPTCNMDTENLEKLQHICRTHRQPAQSVEKCEVVATAQKNSVMSVRGDRGSETCIPERVMKEQNSQDGVSPPPDDTRPEESDCAPVSQQGEPELLHTRLPTYPPSSTPSSAVTDGPSAGEAQQMNEDVAIEAGAATQTLAPLRGPAGPTEMRRERVETTRAPSWERGGEEVAPTSLGKVEEVEALGPEATMDQLGSEVEENLAEELEEEEEEEEEGQGVEVLEVEKATSLDDLAKRIQVEEISPAPGLVSILKRRRSLEGAATPPGPKPVVKRKVRFRVPDDGLDHDEVGGDSWLLLLLLCLATVVISVGGTALYCTFGDAKSSVCTDFSHNMDFYIGQVQRGVAELRHWFSPGS